MAAGSAAGHTPLLNPAQSNGWNDMPTILDEPATQTGDGPAASPTTKQRWWATIGPLIQAIWLLTILVACGVRPCVLSFVYLVAFFAQVQIVAAGGARNVIRAKWLWAALAIYSLCDITGQAVFRAVDGGSSSDSVLSLFGFWGWAGTNGGLQAFAPPVAIFVIGVVQFFLARAQAQAGAASVSRRGHPAVSRLLLSLALFANEGFLVGAAFFAPSILTGGFALLELASCALLAVPRRYYHSIQFWCVVRVYSGIYILLQFVYKSGSLCCTHGAKSIFGSERTLARHEKLVGVIPIDTWSGSFWFFAAVGCAVFVHILSAVLSQQDDTAPTRPQSSSSRHDPLLGSDRPSNSTGGVQRQARCSAAALALSVPAASLSDCFTGSLLPWLAYACSSRVFLPDIVYLQLFQLHFHRLCSLALMAWGVLAPSYLTAPMFVVGAFTMALSVSWFKVVAPWMLAYCMMAIATQFTLMLGGDAWWGNESSLSKHIGLLVFRTPVLSVGAQFGTTLFVALCVRKTRKYSAPDVSSLANNVDCSPVSLLPDLDGDDPNLEGAAVGVRNFLADFWNWFLENTKYFSLVLIFYFSVKNATLVNTMYILMVLLFTAFPGITGTGWRVCLVYSILTNLVTYFLQFAMSSPHFVQTIVGFKLYSVPWRQEGFDGSNKTLAEGMILTILFQIFSMIQLQIIAAQEKTSASSARSSPRNNSTGDLMQFLQTASSPRDPVEVVRKSAVWAAVANVTEACFEEVTLYGFWFALVYEWFQHLPTCFRASYLLIVLVMLQKHHPGPRETFPPYTVKPMTRSRLAFLTLSVLYIATVIMAQFMVQIPWDNISKCGPGDSGLWADWLCPVGLYHYDSTDSDYVGKFVATYAAFVLGTMALRQGYLNKKQREWGQDHGLFLVPVFFCPQWQDMKAAEHNPSSEDLAALLLQTKNVVTDYENGTNTPIEELESLYRQLKNRTLRHIGGASSLEMPDYKIAKALADRLASQTSAYPADFEVVTVEAVWEACCTVKGIVLQRHQLVPPVVLSVSRVVLRFLVLHVRKVAIGMLVWAALSAFNFCGMILLLIALVDILNYGKPSKLGLSNNTACLRRWLNIRNFALLASSFVLLMLYLFQIKPLRRGLRSLLENLLNQTCNCSQLNESPLATDKCLVFGGDNDGLPRYAYGCGEGARNSCLEWATWAGLGPVWRKDTGYHPCEQDVVVALGLAVCLFTLDTTLKRYVDFFPKAWRLWASHAPKANQLPLDRCNLFALDDFKTEQGKFQYVQQMVNSLFLQRGYALTAAVYLIAAFWKTSAVSVWYLIVLTLFIALSHRHNKRLILLRVSCWVVFAITILEYGSILLFNRDVQGNHDGACAAAEIATDIGCSSNRPFFPGFLNKNQVLTLYNHYTDKCSKRSEWLAVDVSRNDLLAELLVLAVTMLQIRARRIYNAYAERCDTAKAAHLLCSSIRASSTDRTTETQLEQLSTLLGANREGSSPSIDAELEFSPSSPFTGRQLSRISSGYGACTLGKDSYQTPQFLFPITSRVSDATNVASCIELCAAIEISLEHGTTEARDNKLKMCRELRMMLKAQAEAMNDGLDENGLKFDANISGFQFLTHLHSIQLVTFIIAILAVTEPTVFGMGYVIHALALFAFPQKSIRMIAFGQGWWWYTFKCWANMVLVTLVVMRSFDAFQKSPSSGDGCWAENIGDDMLSTRIPGKEIAIIVLLLAQDELVIKGSVFRSLAVWLHRWHPLAAQRLRIGAALDAVKVKVASLKAQKDDTERMENELTRMIEKNHHEHTNKPSMSNEQEAYKQDQPPAMLAESEFLKSWLGLSPEVDEEDDKESSIGSEAEVELSKCQKVCAVLRWAPAKGLVAYEMLLESLETAEGARWRRAQETIPNSKDPWRSNSNIRIGQVAAEVEVVEVSALIKSGCLGDAIGSLRLVPQQLIDEDLALIQASDNHDNKPVMYGPDADGYLWEFEHSRTLNLSFQHDVQVTVRKGMSPQLVAELARLKALDNPTELLPTPDSSRSVWRKTVDTVCDQSEIFCFVAIVINHMVNGGVSSMLLCFSCFLYAMVQRPHADHRYWVAVVGYCILMIILRITVSLPTFVPNVAFYGNVTADDQCAVNFATISCGSNITAYCEADVANCYSCKETFRVYNNAPLILGLKKYDSTLGLVLAVLGELLVILLGGFHAGVCEYRGRHQCDEEVQPTHRKAIDELGHGWVEHEEVMSSVTILSWHSQKLGLSSEQCHRILIQPTQLLLVEWLLTLLENEEGTLNMLHTPCTARAILDLFEICETFLDPTHFDSATREKFGCTLQSLHTAAAKVPVAAEEHCDLEDDLPYNEFTDSASISSADRGFTTPRLEPCSGLSEGNVGGKLDWSGSPGEGLGFSVGDQESNPLTAASSAMAAADQDILDLCESLDNATMPVQTGNNAHQADKLDQTTTQDQDVARRLCESIAPNDTIAQVEQDEPDGRFKKVAKHFTSLELLCFGDSCDDADGGIDVYFPMLCFDLIAMVWSLLYVALSDSENPAAVQYDASTGSIPIALFWELILQFAYMLIDRMIYCYQSTRAKLVLQITTVVCFHMLLLYNPPMQLKTTTVLVWYVLKCCYWSLSAMQIRYGYSAVHCRGDYWTSTPLDDAKWEPSFYKLIGYYVYKAIPFLFELRVLVDWICTDTALSFGEWFKLEDIHGQLFVNKTFIKMDQSNERSTGTMQERWLRWLLGGLIVFGLILLLWGPLFIFSSGFPSTTADLVTDSTAVVTMLSQTSQSYIATTIYNSGPTLRSLNKTQSTAVHEWVLPDSEYSIRELQFPANSSESWQPTPPTFSSILSMVHPDQCEYTRLSVRYTFDRLQGAEMEWDTPGTYGAFGNSACRDMSTALRAYQTAVDCGCPFRSDVIILNPRNSSLDPNPTTRQKLLLPRDVGATTTSVAAADEVTLVLRLNRQCDQSGFVAAHQCDILKPGEECNASASACSQWSSWFTVSSFNGKYQDCQKSVSLNNETALLPLSVLVATESQLSGVFGVLQQQGGLAFLYSSVVLLIGRLIRGAFGGGQTKVVYEDMEDVHKPFELCRAIYLARTMDNLEKEETFYRELINLYRNPARLYWETKRGAGTFKFGGDYPHAQLAAKKKRE